MRRTEPLALLPAALAFLGCGGNVVVDGAAATGAGGHGGAPTSGVTTTTSVTSTAATTGSTSSGTPPCSCDDVCKSLAACDLLMGGTDCQSLCAGLSSSAYGCLCDAGVGATCEALATCLGTTFPPTECNTCPTSVAQQCVTAWNACDMQQECLDIWNCNVACAPGQSCMQQCNAAHPMGQAAFAAFMTCEVCKNGPCYWVCGGTPLYQQYCP